MKNNLFKRVVSLVFVVLMMVSAMAVSAISAFAVTNDDSFALIEIVKYNFKFHTAGTDGESSNDIMIRLNGKNNSTDWHDVGKVANDRNDSCDFYDISLFDINSITVKNNGSDGWYPEYIELTVESIYGDSAMVFYGGRWVDNGQETTLSLTDKVVKLNVKTSNDNFSGTDADIFVKLYDKNNNATGNINLSDIYPKFDAFEKGDSADFYIFVNEKFGELSRAEFILDLITVEENIFNLGSDWKLGSVTATCNGVEYTKEVNTWLSGYSNSDYLGPLKVVF